MASGPGRRLAAALIAVAVSACAGLTPEVSEPAPPPSPPTFAPSTTTTTSTTSTTIPPPSTTTTGDGTVSTTAGDPTIDAVVTVPEGPGPFPTVVLVHGGGWVAGDPGIMEPLADLLVANGYLTVNTRYQLATQGNPSFPGAVEDVACAVRYASGLPNSDGSVAVIGHSAGAHIGAIAALAGDDFVGDCPFEGPAVPGRFIGLAGPYDSSRLGLAMLVFFGLPESAAPELWESGNPLELTDSNPDLDSLIMYGEEDGLVADSFAIDFAAALVGSGSTALLEKVEGARHNDMHDPALVGDLIVTWLDR